MKVEIKHRISKTILFSCETELLKSGIELAVKTKTNLRHADLSYADFRNADLSYANFSYADLRHANLSYANLRHANLSYADFSYADFRHADLRHADLRHANLRHANLSYANLRHANLDFSSWPLHCGSFNAKVDDRFVWQFVCHLARLNISACSEETKTAIKKIQQYGNKFCEYRNDVKRVWKK